MVKKSKTTGKRLRKAAIQRKRERFQQMTPRERRQLKRERKWMNQTKEQRLNRELNEVLFGTILGIIMIFIFVWWIIKLFKWTG